MKKIRMLRILRNTNEYEAHPSYYEEILCKVLTVNRPHHSRKKSVSEISYTDVPLFFMKFDGDWMR